MVSSLLSEKGAAMSASRTILPRFKELCVGATICRELKGIGTGKVLCSCENCVRNAVKAVCEVLPPRSSSPASSDSNLHRNNESRRFQ